MKLYNKIMDSLQENHNLWMSLQDEVRAALDRAKEELSDEDFESFCEGVKELVDEYTGKAFEGALPTAKCDACGKEKKLGDLIELKSGNFCPSCAAFMEKEDKLEENFGDTTDYTEQIKKLVKQWWKENADLGIRLFKGGVEVEAKYTEDEFHKPVAYKCTMSALFVETEEFAEEIGIYVAERIPSIEYVKFTHDDEVASENYEDVCIYWKQNQEMPDFGENIY